MQTSAPLRPRLRAGEVAVARATCPCLEVAARKGAGRLPALRHAIVATILIIESAVRAEAADLRVVGTDLLGIEFTKSFYAFAGRNGIPLTLAFDGSRPGIEQLKTGRADCALIVLPAEEMAALRGFTAKPVGYQPVIVLAPASCPVEQITFGQLAAVFGAKPAGQPRAGVRWRDLGATGEWADEFVAPLVPEVGAGVALEYFRHVVLLDGALRRDLPRFASAHELAGQFGPKSRVLALAGALPADAKSMKPLRVANDPARPAIAATAETLHAGRYPLRLPVQLVFSTERPAAAASVAAFLFGDEAAAAMAMAGHVPLPATARAEQLRGMGLNEKPSK